ncbi:MAG: 5-amino-6-(D-ribitylamino)uracil--L-tyrosine 4-hydroxyphenyl transferase CofH [Rhodospirillaceae bacterium]|nr:5-amino-6-(D-ribitylamino)uracil--L-tyrosine 4-hydroxyphenyl transferase CofH [Rhodospirillaceae bacterium]
MRDTTRELLEAARDGHRPDAAAALVLAAEDNLAPLLDCAASLRDRAHPDVVTYSRKVFIPLTHLCRDVCHYCTFARPPRRGETAFMTPEEVLRVVEAGAAAGCKEALFTLGDKPELRYRAAREGLEALGYESTLAYLAAMAKLVLDETELLPHLNPGVLSREDFRALRRVSASQGMMLESASERLSAKGGPHFGSPDKRPAARLETLRLAGEEAVPFTSGILIGIGETREERIEALLALRDAHDAHGHIQEIIVQNFRAKPGTRMADAPEPSLDELLWTIATARILFGPEANIQAPPNLSPGALPQLVAAGIDDWGGVSPVTQDYVNPEAPWPHLDALARETAAAGKALAERLTVYPTYARAGERWLDPALQTRVLKAVDSEGYPRTDAWVTGAGEPPPEDRVPAPAVVAPDIERLLVRAEAGEGLGEDALARLFGARGGAFDAVCTAADALRARISGPEITYVVNRNINYTNVCYFRCQFCAFSKGKLSENLRGRPYDLTLDEIVRRVREAWERGATEVCLQGGIHPDYTGETYLAICRAIKQAEPAIHVHAFSPLEIWQGAATLGRTVPDFLAALQEAGLGSLPGTAAEILDDEVRAIICPDKIATDQWLSVMEAAHALGLRSTATIMFGHVDGPRHWARHLARVRALQERSGGFTEFVPLPFVATEAPLYLKGRARRGPTWREAILMHAVARLALYPVIPNIQTSWVKMGREGAAACLRAGANDIGGTLMNESITRAAGASHGQEFPPEEIEALVERLGRTPVQRTTLYERAPAARRAAAHDAAPLDPVVNAPARRYERRSAASDLVRPGLDAGAPAAE